MVISIKNGFVKNLNDRIISLKNCVRIHVLNDLLLGHSKILHTLIPKHLNFMKKNYIILLLVAFMGNISTQLYGQSVHYVTTLADSGPGSFRELVTQAFPNDTIRFQVQGTIYLSSRVLINKNLAIEGPGMDSIIMEPVSNNSLLIATVGNIDLKGFTLKGGTSTSFAYGAGGLTFSGTNLYMEDVKIDSCTADYNYTTCYGGGAKITGTTVQIENCIFRKNYLFNDDGSVSGGGASIIASQVTINNSTFTENKAKGEGDYNTNPRAYGGALHLDAGTATVQNTNFSTNEAEAINTYSAGSIKGRAYAYGGAIEISNNSGGSVAIDNCNFNNNEAYGLGGAGIGWRYSYAYGGAIRMYNSGQDFIVTNSTFDGNTANAPGGGVNDNYGGTMYVTTDSIAIRTVDVTNSSTSEDTEALYLWGNNVVFEDNYVYNNSDVGLKIHGDVSFRVSNCLFSGNSGSGIRATASTTNNQIINTTFHQNTADEGGAIYLKSSPSQINLINCTLMDNYSNNSNGALAIYVESSTLNLKNNIISLPTFSTKPLVDLGSGGIILSAGGNVIRDNSIVAYLTQTSDQNSTDPKLGTFANHGGRTNAYDLQATSPAIDLGGADTLSVDQRYFLRGANIDAGAIESGATNPGLPTASVTTNNVTLCGNDSTTLSVNAGGASPLNYQWFLGGIAIAGATGSSYTISSANANDAGLYRCHVYNSLDTAISDSLILVVNALDTTTLNEEICQGQTYAFDGQNHTTTGNYTKVETNMNGCDSLVVLNLTVRNLPTVSFTNVSGTNQFCDNQTAVTLLANPSGGAFTGSGVVGNATFNPDSASSGQNIIQYAYTDNHGCTGVMVDTYYLHTAPNVAIIALDTTYCDTVVSVNLTGFPVGGMFSGPGVSGNAFSPAIATVGQHTIVYSYTDANNCSSNDSKVVNVNNCSVLNTSNLEEEAWIVAYPNPVASSLYLEMKTAQPIQSLSVLNTAGQVVQNYENNTQELDVSELQGGLYILRVVTEEKITHLNFIKL